MRSLMVPFVCRMLGEAAAAAVEVAAAERQSLTRWRSLLCPYLVLPCPPLPLLPVVLLVLLVRRRGHRQVRQRKRRRARSGRERKKAVSALAPSPLE